MRTSPSRGRSGAASRRSWTARASRSFSLTLLVLLALAASLLPATAQRPNGAGVVIQFEDGSRVYAYVQFAEESMSSEQLLTRTGLDLIMTPFGGMGAAVCSIQGEGCPASNCWCMSFGNPAYFWHFYARDGGHWVEQLQGPSSRRVEDGDIDGWLWTSGDTSLPDVTIDGLAALNGVELPGGAPAIDGTPLAAMETMPGATAVFVPVDGAAASSGADDRDGASPLTWALFAGMLALGLVALVVIVTRGRAASHGEQAAHDD
ncbi:MAG TPA: hypothetical protein VMM78_07580 [Thermomicrobiales bacterium]|nr:hypothetical protein [Thermomicrobiales bacterium]